MPSETAQRDYVSVVYNEDDKPFTLYPDKLARYLSARYDLKERSRFLDLGCGRGDFLRGFIRCGMNGYGVDRSPTAKLICPEAEILQSDLEKDPLPYDDNTFDIVFSKSVLEHFYYPERIVHEIYRILKPGGLVITMVPDWGSVYKTFYDDFTHRTPYTLTSLKNMLLINNFESVEVEKFRQLPFLWTMPWLVWFSRLVAMVTPGSLKTHSKLIRFSKEVMLLSSAVKPES